MCIYLFDGMHHRFVFLHGVGTVSHKMPSSRSLQRGARLWHETGYPRMHRQCDSLSQLVQFVYRNAPSLHPRRKWHNYMINSIYQQTPLKEYCSIMSRTDGCLTFHKIPMATLSYLLSYKSNSFHAPRSICDISIISVQSRYRIKMQIFHDDSKYWEHSARKTSFTWTLRAVILAVKPVVST